MAFTPKDWQNYPSQATPRSADAMIDLEERLAGYTDERLGGVDVAGLDSRVDSVESSVSVVREAPLSVKDERFDAKGDGTTNDTAAFLAALAQLPAAGGQILVPPSSGKYILDADALDLADFRSLQMSGLGGQSGGTIPASTLHIRNAGSFGLRISSGTGFTMRDLAITYDAAFTGDLVKTRWSAANLDPQLTLLHNITLGDGAVKTAATLLNLEKAVNLTLSGEWNLAGAQRAIKGRASSSALDYSNQIRLFGGRIASMQYAPILNPGDGWTLINTTFQQLAGSGGVNDPVTGVPTVAGQAGAIVSEFSVAPRGLTLINVGFYDSTAGISGQRWIDFTRANAQGVVILGGIVGNADIAFDLGAAAEYLVDGQAWAGAYATSKVRTTGSSGRAMGMRGGLDLFNLDGTIQFRGASGNFLAARSQNNINNTLLAYSLGGANDTYRMMAGGQQEFGDGTAARDVVLARLAADAWGSTTDTIVGGSLRTQHVGAATPTGGSSGDIKVGTGKIWVNDAGTWKSVAVT